MGPISGDHISLFLVTNSVAVRADAAAGADLWMDPILRRTPFFSGRLARAIKTGKFGRIGLKKCLIVS